MASALSPTSARLELLLRPRVPMPTALSWRDDGVLLVGSANGTLMAVDPQAGTQVVLHLDAPVLGMVRAGPHLVVADAAGTVTWLDADLRAVAQGTHEIGDAVAMLPDGETVLFSGDGPTGRRVEVHQPDGSRRRYGLPPGALGFHGASGLEALWASDRGVERAPLQRGGAFSGTVPDDTTLLVGGGHVFRVHRERVDRIGSDGGTVASWGVHGVIAAHGTTDQVAFGTVDGGVTVTPAAPGAGTHRPTTAHVCSEPVAAVALDPTGRWVAAASGRVTLWSIRTR